MKIAILHYSVPPVVGGVETVILAHTKLLLEVGYPVRLLAGAGESKALPPGVEFIHIPEMDTRHPEIERVSQHLVAGEVPPDFDRLTDKLERSLSDTLQGMDHVIVHNIFTKHYNLPLTAALVRLLENGKLNHCIAWCHDFSWTSAHSRHDLHAGYPWDLLRKYRSDVTYVTISRQRQAELSGLYACPPENIKVIYDGVEPAELYSLTMNGCKLVEQLGLLTADLILLMPSRITQAKNIEFALQVTAELKSHGISPKLVITGPPDPHDPEDMQYYRALIHLRHQVGVDGEAHFVYEYGPGQSNGYSIGPEVVRDLYRTSDALFMPSLREGFGMPILEAGLIGMPIFSTEIPAAEEIGGNEYHKIESEATVEETAQMILHWAQTSGVHKLRRRIRHNYTWQAIFRSEILPLLG